MPCSYTNITSNVFLKRKKETRRNKQHGRQNPCGSPGLGLQEAGGVQPWARRSAQATTYSGTLTEAMSYCGSGASPHGGSARRASGRWGRAAWPRGTGESRTLSWRTLALPRAAARPSVAASRLESVELGNLLPPGTADRPAC